MTDKTSLYTQNYAYPEKRFTCLLNEGAITVSNNAYDITGKSQKVCTYASEIQEEDWVAICNDTDNTYEATGGLLLVEKPTSGEQLLIGRIKAVPRTGGTPGASTDADTLAKRLAGGYLRTAVIEIHGFGSIVEGVFVCDGTNAQVPGVATKLKFSVSQGYSEHGLVMDGSGSGGANAVPLHYVPAGTDGDLYSCLFGITGMIPVME